MKEYVRFKRDEYSPHEMLRSTSRQAQIWRVGVAWFVIRNHVFGEAILILNTKCLIFHGSGRLRKILIPTDFSIKACFDVKQRYVEIAPEVEDNETHVCCLYP